MSSPIEGIAKVVHGNGEYSSKLVSLVDRESGALFANVSGTKPASDRDYTTVQVSEDRDIDLNSDLVYMNHSCDPNVILDTQKFEVRVAEGKSLKQGDDVTFFYPSTEWNMQQPFDCSCGTKRCLGKVAGASHLDDAVLSTYWLNPHIEGLLAKRKNSDGSSSSDEDRAK